MNTKKTSKFLSLILRHKPEVAGVELEKGGWASVEALLKGIEKGKGRKITMGELEEIVANNDKKRFSFNDNKTKIRANQGHSVEIDLELKECKPPEVLYHGTYSQAVDSIYTSGINKMQRHHVHLSADRGTATKVGSRRGQPIVLVIAAELMYKDGHKFFVSDNGVWLTNHVPKAYLIANN